MEITGISSEKISVIHNGIDERFVPKKQDEIDNTRKFLGIPSSNYMLSLGSLEPRKTCIDCLKRGTLFAIKYPMMCG